MRSFCIFSVLILFYCSECTEYNNVVFLYDNKGYADWYEIMNFFKNFTKYTWFEYRSENFTSINRENDENVFDEISNSTTSTTTPSNAHAALKRLLSVLQDKKTRSYSVIYVITTATTSCDEALITEILEQIQIKRTQVSFLIESGYPSLVDSLKEYRLISSISNGITWSSKPFKFTQFADRNYLILNSNSQKVNLLAVYGTDNGTYCMKIDSLLKTSIEDMIFNSFDSNEYEIIPSRKPNRTILVDIADRKTTIKNTAEICVEVRKKSQNSDHPSFFMLRGFSESIFDFNYGFSIHEVRSMNETYRRPINDESNKIYVSTTADLPYAFDHFKILFLNGSYFGEEIPLEPIQGTDLFVGSFKPPNKEYFYIQVTTYVNYETITRISFTAMNAADGLGEENQNPTFERKPIERKHTLPKSPESSHDIIFYTNYEYEITGLTLLLLFCNLAVGLIFLWHCEFSKRLQRRTESLGIEQARRRAVPNIYLPLTVREAAQ